MNAFFSGASVFWLNFGLHVSLLSAFVWLACRVMRDPARRSFAAMWGVMAIVVLPWISAAGPFFPGRKVVEETKPLEEIQTAAWPVWTIRIEESPAEVAAVRPVFPAAVSEPRKIGTWRWPALFWLAGTAAGLGGIAFRQWKLARWRKSLREIGDSEWGLVEGLGHGISRHRLRICGERTSPCVIGFFQPHVVIPRFMLEEENGEKLLWALRHEEEHLRAGDSRVAVLLALAKAVMWWNPVVHLLCARWADDRERVCDAAAVGSRSERPAYAALLLDLAGRHASGAPGTATMMAGRSARRMKRRLLDVMSGRIRPKRISPAMRIAAVSAGLVAMLLVSATGVRMEAGEAPSPEQVRVEEPASVEAPVLAERGAGPEEPPEEAGETIHVKPGIKISSRMFLTTERLPEAGRVLDAEEQSRMLERVAETAGNTVEDIPSITMRDGQAASISAVATEGGKGSIDFGVIKTNLSEVRFRGVVLNVLPRIRGREVDLEINFTGHFDPAADGFQFYSKPDEDFDWDTLETISVKTDIRLESGQALILPVEWNGKGNLVWQICASAIDPRGRPVEHFGVPVFPVLPGEERSVPFDPSFELVSIQPPRPCVVRFKGSIFEIPDRNFQIGDHTFEFYPELDDPFGTPFSREEIRIFREESKRAGGLVRIEELDSVEVPSNQDARPWEIFPKLKVKPYLQGWETRVSAEVTIEGWGTTTFSNWPQQYLQSTFDLGKTERGTVRYLLMELEEVRE